VNWVDLAVVGVVAVSALLAFLRGFVRELFGLGAWAGAAAFAVWAAPQLQPHLHRWITNPEVAFPAALAIAFLLALLVLSLIARMVGGLVRASGLGSVDRTLGVVFGLVRGAALVVFAYIAAGLVVAPEQWPEAVQHSQSPRIAYQGAKWIVELLPAEYRPAVPPPPPGRETRAADLLQPAPQGRAFGRR
jgi:membrane protein required for colicin V production